MMNKEIGGYLEFGNLINNPYHRGDCIQLNSARNCLAYLVLKKRIKKIYLPRYICDSVYKVLDDLCTYEFYDIDENLRPYFCKDLKSDEYIYIVNYYGQLSNKELNRLHLMYKNVIIDNVQSFFQKPLKNIDTIYTCRKYFGVSDGAYLFTDMIDIDNLSYEKTNGRFEHLIGRLENNATDFYTYYSKNEEYLDGSTIKLMSKTTEIIMGAIDYENIKQIRNRNFQILMTELGHLNQFDVKFTDGAFAYPFQYQDGYNLRKFLIKNKVFVPLLWPNVTEVEGLKRIAENIIPIPCDQRYRIEDIKYIIKLIKEFIK